MTTSPGMLLDPLLEVLARESAALEALVEGGARRLPELALSSMGAGEAVTAAAALPKEGMMSLLPIMTVNGLLGGMSVLGEGNGAGVLPLGVVTGAVPLSIPPAALRDANLIVGLPGCLDE